MRYLILILFPILAQGQMMDDLRGKGTFGIGAAYFLRAEHSPTIDTTMDNRIMQQTGSHIIRYPSHRLNSTGANSVAIGINKLENKTTGISTQTIGDSDTVKIPRIHISDGGMVILDGGNPLRVEVVGGPTGPGKHTVALYPICDERGHVRTGAIMTTLMYCPPYVVDTDTLSVMVYPACNSSSFTCGRCEQNVLELATERRVVLWRRD